jgi:integrase
MKLTYLYAGETRQLIKHPRVARKLKSGLIDEAAARLTPWYQRRKVGSKERYFALDPKDKVAISDAIENLRASARDPQNFGDYLAERDSKRGRTVGSLADQWMLGGCMYSGAKSRAPGGVVTVKKVMTRLLGWWRPKVWAACDTSTMDEYAQFRRANHRSGTNFTGDRTIERELCVLSCLGRWAVLTKHVSQNPFQTRPNYQAPDDVKHCHRKMPSNDEELDRLLRWCFGHTNEGQNIGRWDWEEMDRNERVAGAWFACQALTGLRPGEPGLLLRAPELARFPDRPSDVVPGTVYPLPDGSRKLKVERLKGGQNKAVVVHPALADFLRTWTSWLALNFPSATHLFPVHPYMLTSVLRRACKALGVDYTPHGFRGYYVRVRRSAGVDDLAIAVELGQASNGKLIRDVYGDPDDGVGGRLYDWLSADGAPAWSVLAPGATENQLLSVNFR